MSLIDALAPLLIPGKPWLLTCEDLTAACASVVIVGRGTASGLRRTRSLESSQTAGLGDYRPMVTITGAQADTISFSSTWAASSIADDLEAIERDILTLADVDPVLGRTPIVRLTVGDISETARITSVSTSYGDGRWSLTGKHTLLEVSLTLVAHHEKSFTSLPFDPETTHVIMGPADTYESLCWEHYGDPALGFGLRRSNPTMPFEVTGAEVVIYETSHTKMIGASKMAAPLLAQATLNQEIMELAIDSLGWYSTPWDSIPDSEKEFGGWE